MGVRFTQKAGLPSAMDCALSVMQTARKTLGKRKNVISEVHLCETTELAPGEGRRVAGWRRVNIPIPKRVALVNGIKEYQTVCVEQHSHYITFSSVPAHQCQGQHRHLQRHWTGPWEDRSDQTSHDSTRLYSLQGEGQEISSTYVWWSASTLKADAGLRCDPTIKQPLDIQCCLGAQA